jgi:hypothetical protein
MAAQNWYIRSLANRKLYIEVTGSAQSNGAVVILNSFTGAPNQQWSIQPDQGAFINACSNLALDVGRDSKRGPNLIQWSYHGRGNQVFDYDFYSKKLRSRLGGVIDVKSGSLAPGQSLLLAQDSNNQSQQWEIVSVSDQTVLFNPAAAGPRNPAPVFPTRVAPPVVPPVYVPTRVPPPAAALAYTPPYPALASGREFSLAELGGALADPQRGQGVSQNSPYQLKG